MNRADIEWAVLGDMLYGEPHPSQSVLEAGDFASRDHRACFEGLVALRSQGFTRPGIMVLDDWLTESGRRLADQPGTLARLAERYSVAENVKPKIAILKRYSTRSDLRELGTSLATSNDSTEALLAQTRSVAGKPRDLLGRDDMESLNDLVTNIEAEITVGPDPRSVPTGFPDLDRFGHMERGSLTVVAARTSIGKTAFACSMAAYWLALGRSVVYCTAEESDRDIARRIGKIMPPPGVSLLRGSRLAVRSCRRLEQVALAVADADEPEIVVVDHLHELHSEKRRDSQVLELGDLMQGLRDIAKDQNVPIVVLAQLSREPTRRENQKPRLEDLRGSGSIEEKADRVWMLWRDTTEAELMVAKNRSGPRNEIVHLTFIPEQARFASYASGARHATL